MSRKTSSISLRLKKTNRDFNDCWYAGVLYKQSLSKSFKIKSHLSQALKATTVPRAHLSVIGAHKKLSIVAGYLHPSLSRQKRCERLHLKAYSKSFMPPLPAAGLGRDFFAKAYFGRTVLPTLSLQTSLVPSALLCNAKPKQKGEGPALQAQQGKQNKKGALMPLMQGLFADQSKGGSYRRNLGLVPPALAEQALSFIIPKGRKSLDCAFAPFSQQKKATKKKTCASTLLASFAEQSKQSKEKATALQGLLLQSTIPTSVKNQSICSLPIYNTFPLIALLSACLCFASTLLAEESKGKAKQSNAYYKAENKTCFWFSQRRSLFCLLTQSESTGLQRPVVIAQQEKRMPVLFAAADSEKANPCFVKEESESFKGFFLDSVDADFGPRYSYMEEIKPYLGRLQSAYSDFWGNAVCLSFYKSISDTSSALFLAHSIAYLLERRVPFRRFKTHFLSELSALLPLQRQQGLAKERPQKAKDKQDIKKKQGSPFFVRPSVFHQHLSKIAGVRIYSSGRVGGGASKKAQRSRKEKLIWGETGLHVFSSRLDFAQSTAKTTFGSTGIKVWICYK